MRYTYTIERIEIMKHTAFTMAGAGQRAFLTGSHTYGCAAFTMADWLSPSTESVAERLPQVNPHGNTTKKSTEHCHPKLHERAAAEIRNACHAELDSASIQCCELPVTLDRYRNKFGMTLAEAGLQWNLSKCTTRKVDAKDVTQSSSRGANGRERRGDPIKNVASSCHPELDSGSDQHCELPVTLDRFRNKFGMTPTESKAIMGLYAYGRRMAFTMAEILLSLTIIGVVAAITLPSLTGNINERTWNTQRKALYARFSQAMSLMPSLNGYGSYSGTNTDDIVTATVDTAAETFVTNGLAKVLKINNICDSEHLEDCGIVTSYTNIVGTKKTMPTKLSELNPTFTSTIHISNAGGSTNDFTNPQNDIDTKAAAFETTNGESILVLYNPRCQADMNETKSYYYIQPKMCANFIYDLNGNKGPNTVGKDIGILTALYPTDPIVVAPMLTPQSVAYENDRTQYQAGRQCAQIDSETRPPNKEELMAMFYNKDLFDLSNGGGYWSSTVVAGNADKGWLIQTSNGLIQQADRNQNASIKCVKR